MALLKPKWQFEIDEFQDSKNYRVHVHTLQLNDVEDAEIYAEPLYEWQKTEKGKWIMEHSAPSPSYHRYMDYLTYGYVYHVCAYLSEKDYAFYRLKYE